ncbi:MAG TPA: hypothetical protein VMR16_00500 [Candidatus Saccharimonadales bacterium]|nr:hypothetical protein [Candidatus Saccharimonadales bacterium]
MGKINIRKIVLVAVFLFGATIIPIMQSQTSYAAALTSRSLTLQQGTDPGSKIGGVVNNYFAFTIPTTGMVGSIQFLYCTTATGTCTTPTGLSTTTATLTAQTGATGFVIDSAHVNGQPYITRTAATVTGPQIVNYTLSGVTNPTVTAQTFYVRISTYTAATLGGTVTDTGNVAAATALQIVLTGTMPESLVFCSGATISTNGVSGVPDCSTATVSAVAFNQQFSPATVATANSQLAASTNAGTGYVITVNGTSMTNGSNPISGMAIPTVSEHGVSQFGLNLKLNTTATSSPAVGAEVAPASNGSNLRGAAAANYNTVDSFTFNPGDTVATSAAGSDAQIYTVTYIVNVPGSQPAGTYSTTLTYICTPKF